MDKITSSYIHSLQALCAEIGNRGIRVDIDKLKKGKIQIQKQILENLKIASDQWGCVVFIGATNDPGKSDKTAVNLNATQGERALLAKLKDIGYHVPKITSKNKEGEYESKFSTGELALQKMLAENQFKYPTGDPAIRAILKVRELGKLQSGYFNTRLLRRSSEEGEDDYYFLSIYNAAGTITGRRSGKRHTFGFGNNPQNFPKHSETARFFRECLVPRRGNIFLFVDQIQAEEWPVSALAMNQVALHELRTGVDRHSKLASAIFDTYVPPKSSPEWDDAKHDKMRYLGKKVKHARNYGMKKRRMSESLAQEGFSVSEDTCAILLDKAAKADPSIDTVFHRYVIDTISATHTLCTPFNRERMFLGARPNSDNSTLFNEAFAYIPQSVVGDNTGFALSYLESGAYNIPGLLIQEGHDSLVRDLTFDKYRISEALERTREAFDRDIQFHNGITINIPIEAELGYDFNDTVKIKSFDESGIKSALEKLEEKKIKKEEAEKKESEVTFVI